MGIDYFMDAYGAYDPDPEDERVYTCKYCGEGGLYWSGHTGKWRLYRIEDNEMHICNHQKTEGE